MAASRQVTVTTTPTAILSGNQGVAVIRVGAAGSVFIGGPAVTTGTGFELKNTDYPLVITTTGDPLYGIVASATLRCDVLEID